MEHRSTHDAEGMAMEADAVTEAPQERRPCVLVAHAWDGPNEHVRGLARSLAALGFAAWAIKASQVPRFDGPQC